MKRTPQKAYKIKWIILFVFMATTSFRPSHSNGKRIKPSIKIQQFGYCVRDCKNKWLFNSGSGAAINHKILAYNPGQSFATGVFGFDVGKYRIFPKELDKVTKSSLYILSYKPRKNLSDFINPKEESWVKLPIKEPPFLFMRRVLCAFSLTPEKIILVRKHESFKLQKDSLTNKWSIERHFPIVKCDMENTNDPFLDTVLRDYKSTKFFDLSKPSMFEGLGDVGVEWGPFYFNPDYYWTTQCGNCIGSEDSILITIWDAKTKKISWQKLFQTYHGDFRFQQIWNNRIVTRSDPPSYAKKPSFFNVFTFVMEK